MTALSIVGSTGSIGTQTLEIVRSSKNAFTVRGLACASNIETLAFQIETFHPEKVAVYDVFASRKLAKKLSRKDAMRTEIFSGQEGIDRIASDPLSDTLVLGMTGEEAISPLLAGISAEKKIVLVNKEAVVCHGEKIAKVLKKSSARIFPADSEHSAIFRCIRDRCAKISQSRGSGLARVDLSDVEKIILPCSGGPFFGKTRQDIASATLEDALNHPLWKMGKKILIDSAALINKGLEVIEAHYLFGIPYEKIEVVVHPECWLHGAVFWNDGTVSALFHPPDMKYPLSYALYTACNSQFRKRSSSEFFVHFPLSKKDRCQSAETILRKMCRMVFPVSSLTFYPIDHATFPAIRQAYEAGKAGGNASARYCREYGRAVHEFLKGKISFVDLL